MKRVLVIGQDRDPHVASVCGYLQQHGAEVVLVDRFVSPRLGFSVSQRGSAMWFHQTSKNSDKLEPLPPVHSVWNRVKPLVPNRDVQPPSFVDEDAAAFWINEWRSFEAGLIATVSAQKWMNPLCNRTQYDSKIWQLSTAVDVGLDVPRTVVSNDPSHILATLTSEYLIYKPLFFTPLRDRKLIFASRIHRSVIEAQADAIKGAPGIFQEYVAKDYEMRVIAVGERIFAARLNSQDRADTQIDWRRNQVDLTYDNEDLPLDVLEKLLRFQRRSGQCFGAFDLIRTPDGRYVFLECNSVGQWLWIEERMRWPVSEAVAQELAA